MGELGEFGTTVNLYVSGTVVWHTGSGVPSDLMGNDGDLYLDTSNGDIYQKLSGSWGSPILNITGSTGADGKTVLNGAVDPTTEGVDGDFYINTSTSYIFGPKAGGVWPAGVSLIGPQGPQGIQGNPGPNTVTASTTTNLTGILTGDGNNVGSTPDNHANWDQSYAWGSVMNEPTGFPDRTSTSISFNNGNRTFTISPTGVSFDYYMAGVKYTKSVAQTKQITDDEGIHYIYFNGATLSSTTNFNVSLITSYVMVALIYWDKTNQKQIHFADERHGLVMDNNTHLYLHQSVGCAYESGLGMSANTVDGTGNAAGDAQIDSVGNGSIADEDITVSITGGSPQTLSPIAQIPIYYRSGSNATVIWRVKPADNYPIIYSGTAGYTGANGRLPYNLISGGNWSLTQVGQGNFVLVHYFATTDVNTPIVGVQGQNEYTTLASARAGADTEIYSISLDGLPGKEFKAIGTFIFDTAATYGNIPKARIRSTTSGTEYVDHRASKSTVASTTSIHNNLAGLQGGCCCEYYHLQSCEYTKATQAATSANCGLLTAANYCLFCCKADYNFGSNMFCGCGNIYLTCGGCLNVQGCGCIYVNTGNIVNCWGNIIACCGSFCSCNLGANFVANCGCFITCCGSIYACNGCVCLSGCCGVINTTGCYGCIGTTGICGHIFTCGANACIYTCGCYGSIVANGCCGCLTTCGTYGHLILNCGSACIYKGSLYLGCGNICLACCNICMACGNIILSGCNGCICIGGCCGYVCITSNSGNFVGSGCCTKFISCGACGGFVSCAGNYIACGNNSFCANCGCFVTSCGHVCACCGTILGCCICSNCCGFYTCAGNYCSCSGSFVNDGGCFTSVSGYHIACGTGGFESRGGASFCGCKGSNFLADCGCFYTCCGNIIAYNGCVSAYCDIWSSVGSVGTTSGNLYSCSGCIVAGCQDILACCGCVVGNRLCSICGNAFGGHTCILDYNGCSLYILPTTIGNFGQGCLSTCAALTWACTCSCGCCLQFSSNFVYYCGCSGISMDTFDCCKIGYVATAACDGCGGYMICWCQAGGGCGSPGGCSGEIQWNCNGCFAGGEGICWDDSCKILRTCHLWARGGFYVDTCCCAGTSTTFIDCAGNTHCVINGIIVS